MKNSLLAGLAGLSLLAASGCGGLSVIDDKGVSTTVPARPLGAVKPLDLSACVVPDPAKPVPDRFYGFMTSYIPRAFSSTGGDCDVRITAGLWDWTVSAARTGRTLFRVVGKVGAGSNLSSWMPRAVYERLQPGSALHDEAAAGRGSVPAAAPALARAPAAPSPAPAPSYSSTVDTPRYSVAERPSDLAVVVGIESYSDIAAKAPYAERDAAAFAAHAKALGVPQRNVVLLTGSKAGRASLEKYLEQWLPNLVKPESTVYFYFSGHGAPDVKSGQAYLVPWDGDPNFLETTAYPVKRLYSKLQALKAKRVVVAMDSCFSGAGGRSVLASGARPLVTKVDAGAVSAPGMTVLTASSADQISGSLDDKGHGAFTYFLLEGLNGGSKDLSAAGLLGWLTPRVQDESRRLNREQTPQLLGDGAFRLR